jgi:DNA-binding transcriptional MerR regulator
MNTETKFRTPQLMMSELDISAATLRRWSEEFADYVSAEAGATEGGRHRRYTEEDLATLTVVKELMNEGMTYEQVRQQLSHRETLWAGRISRIVDDDEFEDDLTGQDKEVNERGIIAVNGSDSAALDFITNTLATLSDNQKSVLNSQAANRELLGVLIQDNFNLKEENNRLRERVLDVEQNLAQTRHEDEWRRESLRQEMDAKLNQVQQLASEALRVANTPQPPPEIKAVKSKPGCLGSLFGGGDIQIISSTRRRGQGHNPTAGGAVTPYGATPVSPPQQTQGPSHPKPTAPPE